MTTTPLDRWSDVEIGFKPGEPWEAFYVFRGKPGTGKTTLACGIPDSLLVDMDPAEGGKYVVNPRAARLTVRSWDEMEALWKRLQADAKENGDKKRFKVVILDPAGQMLTFCRHKIKQVLGVDEITGFDHGRVNSLFREKYLDLLNWGYYLVILDHIVDVRVLTKGGVEQIIPEALLPQGITKYLEQDCHHILTNQLIPSTRTEKDPSTGKDRLSSFMSFRLTTKPGRKTSLANPKTRVWLPEELTDFPQTGDASEIWDHFATRYHESVAAMVKAMTDKKKG